MATERLIYEVQKYPQLYAPKHKLYKDAVNKTNIWTLIRSEVYMTGKQFILTGVHFINSIV